MKHHRTILLSLSHPTETVLTGFNQFWSYHITGFNDERHCKRCFIGKNEKVIHKKMEVTPVSHPLVIPIHGHYFYICGVSRFKRSTDPESEYMKNNFHLPLQWKPGSTVTMETYNKYTFVIQNTEEVQFNSDFAKEHYKELGEDFYTCRNFQFAAEMYAEK